MLEYEIEKSCCFTGHRSHRLPWGENEEDEGCQYLKKQLRKELEYLYEIEEIRHFISGMALGTDIYFAEIVLALKKVHKNITLEAAIPCTTQSKRWTREQKQRYEEVLAQCNTETVVQHHYSKDCMMKRNCYMVDHSHIVVSVYDGKEKGGTHNTLQYAKKMGRQRIILSPYGGYGDVSGSR